MRKWVVTLLIVLIASSAGGWGGMIWATSSPGVAQSADEDIASLEEKHKDELSKLRSDSWKTLSRMTSQIADLEDQFTKLSSREKRFQVAIPKLVHNLSIGITDPSSAKLTDDVVELLSITDEERRQLDIEILRTRYAILKLEAKHTKVTKSQNKVVLTVSPYRTSGASIRSELFGHIRRILGDKCAQVLTGLRGGHYGVYGEWMHGFGRLKYGYTFSKAGRKWKMDFSMDGTTYLSYNKIDSRDVGRFYRFLPPDIQKCIEPQHRGIQPPPVTP